jgi:hypothetical protein
MVHFETVSAEGTVEEFHGLPSLPAFFEKVGDDVTEARLYRDGELVAAFDTTETWWRQDMIESNGKSWLKSLGRDES